MNGRKKILVVDDIPEYLDMIEGFLSDEYDILKALNIKEAKGILESEKVDLAIIDVRLDEEDEENKEGLDLLKWIKDTMPEVPVIMISAYKEFEFEAESLVLGAEKFLKKPINPSELQETVREILK